MSHRVVIIVIADSSDNLPVVICTIEEYFHFSLFLPVLSFLSSRLDCSGSHQRPRLVCSRGERDLSSVCNILSASRGETKLHHVPQPLSILTSLFLCLTFFSHSHSFHFPEPSPKLFTLSLTFPLSFSAFPFISKKASAVSCHQHCLQLAFDRGISSPLFLLSLFSIVFSLPYPPSHVTCHLLPIVSVVFSGREIRQL